MKQTLCRALSLSVADAAVNKKRDFDEISGNQITKQNRRWIPRLMEHKKLSFFFKGPLEKSHCLHVVEFSSFDKTLTRL